MLLGTGGENEQIFSPSGNLQAGPGPKGQSPVAGGKDTEGGNDTKQKLALHRDLA